MGLVIDIVDGSGVDEAVTGSNLTRVAYVYGLDAGAPPADSSALLRALEEVGLPHIFDVHPNESDYFCNRRVVKPVSDSSMMVDLNYFRGIIQGSTWLMTEDTTTIPATTQIHPGTGKQIQLLLDVPNTVLGFTTKSWIAEISYAQTLRRISYEGSIIGYNIPGVSGQPSPFPGAPGTTSAPQKQDFLNAINHVNSASWQGLGIGYWWFNGWSVTTPDRGASNTIKASFLTKVNEDWSTYAVLRDTNNGKYITVDPAVVASLRSQTYVYDVLYSQLNNGVNPNGTNTGIAKIGPYPLANFINLFGN